MTALQRRIIHKLANELSDDQDVFGLVLIGSSVLDKGDEYSDLDFWATVKDSQEKTVLNNIEKILQTFGNLDTNFQLLGPNGELGRRVFHISDTPPWHKIEFGIATLSNKYTYTKNVDPPIKILINKNNAVSFQEQNESKLKQKAKEKLDYNKNLFATHKSEIEKYCYRDKFLEAFLYYETYALQPLVSCLRSIYSPGKLGFHLKHAYKDLPKNYISEVEGLYKVRTTKDILENTKKVDLIIKDLKP